MIIKVLILLLTETIYDKKNPEKIIKAFINLIDLD